jgi:CHAT domain-containing protein
LGTVNALAVAFLDAGVEEVVASAWEVGDGVSASLATKLHERHRGARAEVRTTYDAAGDALQSSGYITYSR